MRRRDLRLSAGRLGICSKQFGNRFVYEAIPHNSTLSLRFDRVPCSEIAECLRNCRIGDAGRSSKVRDADRTSSLDASEQGQARRISQHRELPSSLPSPCRLVQSGNRSAHAFTIDYSVMRSLLWQQVHPTIMARWYPDNLII